MKSFSTNLGAICIGLLLTACGGESEIGGSVEPGGNSSSTSSSSSSSNSSSNSSGEVTISCADESDVIQVFKDNACDTCHNPSFPEEARGGLDLVSPQLASRVVGVPTYIAENNPSCADGKVVDVASPTDSLMLTLTSAEAHADLSMQGCERAAMPQTKKFMSQADHSCVATWVEKVANEGTGPTDTMNQQPFAVSDAESALARAKHILHGGALTAAELDRVKAKNGSLRRTAMKELIQEWEGTPAFETKVTLFLETATNQLAEDFGMFGAAFIPRNGVDADALRSNVHEMFTRRAWEIVDNEEDFREIYQTRKWHVTTAILGLLYVTDAAKGKVGLRFQSQYGPVIQPGDYKDWRAVTFEPTGSLDEGDSREGFMAQLRDIKEGETLPLYRPLVGFFNAPAFLEFWETNVDNDFRITLQQTFIAGLDSRISAADLTGNKSTEGIVRFR